jgi:hypothetical protein
MNMVGKHEWNDVIQTCVICGVSKRDYLLYKVDGICRPVAGCIKCTKVDELVSNESLAVFVPLSPPQSIFPYREKAEVDCSKCFHCNGDGCTKCDLTGMALHD